MFFFLYLYNLLLAFMTKYKQNDLYNWINFFLLFIFTTCVCVCINFSFLFSIYRIKMIGLAQGPGPCVSRHFANSSATVHYNKHSIAAVNCHKTSGFIVCSTFISSSLCPLIDYEIEVLRFVGPLTAEAPISRSAWSQWEEVRQIIATTQIR